MRILMVLGMFFSMSAIGACPVISVTEPIEMNEPMKLSFLAPNGYSVATSLVVPDTMLRLSLLPEGVSAQDFGLRKVDAAQLSLQFGLRPMPDSDIDFLRENSQGKHIVSTAEVALAYREDVAPPAIRYVILIEQGDQMLSGDLEFSVPEAHVACRRSYESASARILESISFE
jgi:hypothetical protein